MEKLHDNNCKLRDKLHKRFKLTKLHVDEEICK